MKWISVSERLPERNVRVLVVASPTPGVVKRITIADWSEHNHWEIDPDDRLICINNETITHWMPLPAPPESDNKK